MHAERGCEEGNEQASVRDSVEVLEETNGNMDTSNVESNATVISTGTTVLLWNEKSDDEQWNHSHNLEEQGKQADNEICQKMRWKVSEIGRMKMETGMSIQ